jgi:hypothetical protein
MATINHCMYIPLEARNLRGRHRDLYAYSGRSLSHYLKHCDDLDCEFVFIKGNPTNAKVRDFLTGHQCLRNYTAAQRAPVKMNECVAIVRHGSLPTLPPPSNDDMAVPDLVPLSEIISFESLRCFVHASE